MQSVQKNYPTFRGIHALWDFFSHFIAKWEHIQKFN